VFDIVPLIVWWVPKTIRAISYHEEQERWSEA
jgi:hypothetical protein